MGWRKFFHLSYASNATCFQSVNHSYHQHKPRQRMPFDYLPVFEPLFSFLIVGFLPFSYIELFSQFHMYIIHGLLLGVKCFLTLSIIFLQRGTSGGRTRNRQSSLKILAKNENLSQIVAKLLLTPHKFFLDTRNPAMI